LPVPKLLHRIAIGEVPPKYEEYWGKWQELHPTWEFRTWVPPFHPEDWETGQFFEEASHPSQLSDFLRWEIIHSEGGVYTDWDVEPYRAFDSWLEHDFFIGTEDGSTLSPGLFGAVPKHPGCRAVIDSHLAHEWGTNPATSGPQTVSRVLGVQPGIHVVPQKLFYPYHYTEMSKADQSWPDAYSAHHWGHSWKNVM
jgi:mannosyltransferase OCH1-like enzyme